VSDNDVSTRILQHIDAALNFERNRKITTPQVYSKGKSSRFPCALCGVGIRKETTPVNGMHPKCNLVAQDPENTLKMPINSHAARAIHDRIVVQAKKNDADIAREAAEKLAHKELLARFEASDPERNANAS